MIHSQDFTPKTLPLKHQIEAIKFLIDTPIAALFDEQGLGKTKIVIDALSILMRNEEIQGALIIAPLSLVHNWEEEVLKHSHLIPIVLRGTKKEKRYKLLTGANFYITNYEAVVVELDRIKRFCRSRKIAIILDEASRIKDPKTKTAKSIFEIAPLAQKRIIVTGTPVANKPFDLWSLYFFLDQGRLLGSDFNKFKLLYSENNPDYISKLSELQQIIMANSIRRTKEDSLELPHKVYKNIYVKLKGQQLELYERIKQEVMVEITKIDGSKVIDEIDNILKKLLRLTQVASNPVLIDSNYKEMPSKYQALSELVNRIVSKSEKAIIWTCFVGNILILKKYFKEYNPLVIYGDIKLEQRADFVTRFQSSEKHKILIANPAAAREGLTLTRANNAIYLDRNFNLIDYMQSQDRIHRISQEKTCYIYKIIALNTIDEYIEKIIELKSNIAHFVEGDVSFISNSNIDTLLNKSELLQMLGGNHE